PGAFCDEPAFGSGEPTSPIQDLALAADAAGFPRDRADEVDTVLEARVTPALGKHGLHGTAHRGIQNGHRIAAVDDTERVVHELTWLTDEDDSAFFRLRSREAHSGRDRRRRA